MPRRSSFSSNKSRGPSRQSTKAAPRPQQRTTPQQGGGFFSNMMGSIGTGLGFGVGSEIGHQAVKGIMGGNSNAHAQPQEQVMQNNPNSQSNPCQVENNNFVDCLKFNSNNINSCQDLLDNLKACETRFN